MSSVLEPGRQLPVLFVLLAVCTAALVPIGVAGTQAGERVDEPGVNDEWRASETSREEGRISAALSNATGTVETVVRFETRPSDVRSTDTGDGTVQGLKSNAHRSQAELRNMVGKTSGLRIEREFWLANAALVTVDTDRIALERIAAIDGVQAVHENVRLEPPTVGPAGSASDLTNTVGSGSSEDDHARSTSSTGGTSAASATTYGPGRIAAEDAWTSYDARGDDVRVAVLDTGIDTSHSDLALADEEADWAYFDDGGDPVDSKPFDDHGHGTMVSGIVAGGSFNDRHYGVAPDVHLMHAKVLDPTGTFAQIVAGMEWAIERDAHVLSMSFGTSGFHESFVEPIRNARRSGAVVVAAAGNHGRNTSIGPANVYETFAVGASTPSGDIWADSSGERIETDRVLDQVDRPASWPDEYVVPDVAAPGASVLSTYPTNGRGQDRYARLSGTSMAAPHVAGAVALVMSAVEERTVAGVQEALTATASKPGSESSEPDIRYGHGIVDVTAAIGYFNGTLNGSVRAARTGDPIQGATVSVLDNGEVIATRRTDPTGSYNLTVSQGRYDVLLDAAGYDASRLSNVTVRAQSRTTSNVTLVDNVTVRGTVADAHADTAISNATVTLKSDGEFHNTTTDSNGTYAFEGLNATDRTYELAADAPGYEGAVAENLTTVGSDTVVRNLTLSGSASINGAVHANGTDTLPENMTVTATTDRGTYVGAVSEGTFTIPGIPARNRTVTVRATATAFDTNATSVRVNSSVSDLDFVLSRRPWYLAIRDVEIPTRAEAGNSYEVTVSVANLGTGTVTDTIVYGFGNTTMRTASITLNATETTTVTFEHAKGTAGTYDHSLRTANETRSRRLEIQADQPPSTRRSHVDPDRYLSDPARPRVSVNATITPANGTIGDPVRISVQVLNDGTEASSQCLRVAVGNTTVGWAAVSVSSDETATVQHRHVLDTTGNLDVTVTNETVESPAECDPTDIARTEAVTDTITVTESNATSTNDSSSDGTPAESARTATGNESQPHSRLTPAIEGQLGDGTGPTWGLGIAAGFATVLVGLGLRSRAL
jgi:subtilisin family serine protease